MAETIAEVAVPVSSPVTSTSPPVPRCMSTSPPSSASPTPQWRHPGRTSAPSHRYRGPKAGEPRIDWILTTKGLETVSTRIDTFNVDGTYPSDHFPVEATLRWADDVVA